MCFSWKFYRMKKDAHSTHTNSYYFVAGAAVVCCNTWFAAKYVAFWQTKDSAKAHKTCDGKGEQEPEVRLIQGLFPEY